MKLQRILYVEDDPHIAEITIMTLEDLGEFEVLHCSSGDQALQQLSAYQPQLVLMDVMMPGMDGPETFRQMKKTQGTHHIPVIFITAKAQRHEQQQYMEMGAIGVIVKPYDPVALCSTLVSMWNKHHQENSQTADKLSEIKQRFLNELEEAFPLFLEMRKKVGAQNELRDFEDLHDICHRVAGTAPLLGLDDLGQYARTIDQQLSSCIAKADSVSIDSLQRALDDFIAAAQESISATASAQGTECT